jgi:riboflavin transporter
MSMIRCNSGANGKVRMREATKRSTPEVLSSGGFFFFMNWIGIVTLTLFTIVFIITLKVYSRTNPSSVFDPIRFMARVAIFGGMSAILYIVPVFQVNLFFFPSFLALHFDEIPAFICGFAYGPWAAFAVIAIKTIFKLPFTSSMMVGELTDFILSSLYVVPAVLIYQRMRNLKGVSLAFGVATFVQLTASMLLNVYVMIPFYEYMMGFSESGLLFVIHKAIPWISDVGWSYAFFAVLPFNALKDAIVIVITFIIYRNIHVVLRFTDGRGIGKKMKKKTTE